MSKLETSESIKINPEDGATFREIVSFIMKQTGYDEGRTKKSVIEVLKAGMAMKKIMKTPSEKYLLIRDSSKPLYINYHIREPNFSDDSDDDDSIFNSDDSVHEICSYILNNMLKPTNIFF